MSASMENEAELRRELERMTAAIERYSDKLDSINGQLVMIDEENENDDVNRQIKEYESTMSKQRKPDIAAEDALDNIVRMQNQLKIVRRRNQLLAKEYAIQQKQLADRAKELKKTSDELDMVCEATGWNGDFEDVDFDEVNAHKASTHDTLIQEQEIRHDIKTLQVLVQKKEAAIVNLTREINSQKDRRAEYNQLNNDIRVAQRDTKEKLLRVERMQKEDASVDRALVEVQEQDVYVSNSVTTMEMDKEFLAEAVLETKMNCRRQDNVTQAQLARQQQLQKRLESVMTALREMKLDKEFERNVSKSGLVPSASRAEPEDVAQILPEDEAVPVDTYRLLYKNNEMMRTNVARKNMLVLEKESVIQSMDTKLRYFIDAHNQGAEKDDVERVRKNAQVNDMVSELQTTHKNYQHEIHVLEEENKELQRRLTKKMAAVKRELVHGRSNGAHSANRVR